MVAVSSKGACYDSVRRGCGGGGVVEVLVIGGQKVRTDGAGIKRGEDDDCCFGTQVGHRQNQPMPNLYFRTIRVGFFV